MTRITFLIAWALAFSTSAHAQSSGLKRRNTGDESRGWEAVGHLDVAGKGFCTGALIAPDLVLTAAQARQHIYLGINLRPLRGCP